MKFKTYDEVKPKLDKLKEEEKADALKVGRKEGIAAGKMLGLAEGLIEGKQERNIEIAQTMLKNNVDIDIIISSTGLTKKEIKKIENDTSSVQSK